MFKSRRSGTTAGRTIMGLDAEFRSDDIPDFLHTTYEVTWAGPTEDEARARYGDVVTIQVPPAGMALADTPLPMAEARCSTASPCRSARATRSASSSARRG